MEELSKRNRLERLSSNLSQSITSKTVNQIDTSEGDTVFEVDPGITIVFKKKPGDDIDRGKLVIYRCIKTTFECKENNKGVTECTEVCQVYRCTEMNDVGLFAL